MISLAYDKALYECNVSYLYRWDETNPALCHALIAGGSGSGKSFCALQLLSQLVEIPGCRLFVVDFKGADEFQFLKSVPGCRYYAHIAALDGLTAFYSEFESRTSGNPDRSPFFLFLDEYTSMYSFYSTSDKKLAASCLMMFANLVFMSRGVGGHVICSVQRPDSTGGFPHGIRDQFGVRLLLGQPSPEAAQMMFSDRKSEIAPDFAGGVGVGHLYMDGMPRLACVRVPFLDDLRSIQGAILKITT